MRSIDAETRLCAIIGHPVKHSLSPLLHNAAFESLGLNYVYLAFDVEELAGCLAGMRAMEAFRGLSVTIPHKMNVIAHLDEVDPIAAKVGSVNTISNVDGRLVGTTTDGRGMLRAFDEAGMSLQGKRVLFLGSGGGVRAVAFAVAELAGPASIRVLGIVPEEVHGLVQDLSGSMSGSTSGGNSVDDLAEAMAEAEVVIHGTPVGMHGASEGESIVPPELLESRHIVFDMVYRPLKTKLLEDAEEAGCATVQGIEMLLWQAALQFEMWTGAPAPVEAMRAALRSAMDL